jgi:hypothetical protein
MHHQPMPNCANVCDVVDEQDVKARARVIEERVYRRWSARQASEIAEERGVKMSPTTWLAYEGGGKLGPTMTRGVAAVFEWPNDWPTNLPLSPERRADAIAEILRIVQELQRSQDLLLQFAETYGRLVDGGRAEPARNSGDPTPLDIPDPGAG